MSFIFANLDKLLTAILATVQMVAIALAAALSFGLLVGSLIYLSRAEGLMPKRGLNILLNSLVNLTRSVPFLLFVVLLIPVTRRVVGTGFGTLAAAFPLSLIAIALYARLVEQSLLEVDPQLIQAGIAMGATPLQILREIILVQARSGLVLGLTSLLISLMSYSTVMGLVGGGGIGDFAITFGYQGNHIEIMFAAVIIMILLIQMIQGLGSALARQLDKRY